MNYWALYRQCLRAESDEEARRIRERKRTPKEERPKCGARCRDGHACRAPAVWDFEHDRPRNGRCRVHGGLSTGPRTEEGKQRSREGARRGGLVAAERRRAMLQGKEHAEDGATVSR